MSYGEEGVGGGAVRQGGGGGRGRGSRGAGVCAQTPLLARATASNLFSF